MAVDDLIGTIQTQLKAKGVANNTDIVFSSDNGYHMGEYRLLAGKQTAFDTDIHVPLIVSGPDIPAGRTVTQLASNVDLAPTFETLAGAAVGANVDGVSLAGLWHGQPPRLAAGRAHRAPRTRRHPGRPGRAGHRTRRPAQLRGGAHSARSTSVTRTASRSTTTPPPTPTSCTTWAPLRCRRRCRRCWPRCRVVTARRRVRPPPDDDRDRRAHQPPVRRTLSVSADRGLEQGGVASGGAEQRLQDDLLLGGATVQTGAARARRRLHPPGRHRAAVGREAGDRRPATGDRRPATGGRAVCGCGGRGRGRRSSFRS